MALIFAGILIIAIPLWQIWHRASNDSTALYTWQHGGSTALAARPVGTSTPIPTSICSAANAPAADYALVTFPVTNGVQYADVATQGTWNQLLTRSMVHYNTSPNPGQPGNMIIGFHREPQFEYINQMNVGQSISIETRDCATYTYRITGKWVLAPSNVTQLVPTSGSQLTLITCTPWWIDTDRIVWRATLVASTPPEATPAAA